MTDIDANDHRTDTAEAAGPASEKFGTFLGVYTPSVLTILGLIMYLRFGWVVGNVGLGITLLIVLLASAITFITAMSASAVSTNMQVGVGGEYFMISRSLGLELGGAIGIPLFLCRTLSITFYSYGLSESLLAFWPASWGAVPPYTEMALAAAIIVVITLIAGKSAGLALRLQIPIMVAVGLSLIAMVIGVFTSGLQAPEMTPVYRTAPQGFWYVFAIFFPAVTGFTAGIGMSGDLKDPRRSIPRGTLWAVGTGTLVYLTIPVLMAITMRVSPEQLAQPGVIWVNIAVLGAWLVFPGLWGAILSSAFGSVLGGPRVLQALANDGLAPSVFARLTRTGQPLIATLMSGVIALAAVGLGDLNSVARFVTILFLTLYVMINLSAALERLVGDPSYRPTISVPWYISILGSVGAVVVMFLISPVACVIAISLEIILYTYLRRRSLRKRWGDVRAGVWMALARFALLQLKRHSAAARNWRPNILLFAGDPHKRSSLVRLACWFNQNRGVVTVCRLITGDLEQNVALVDEMRREMDRDIAQEGLVAFGEVNVVEDFERGVVDVAQANGIAGLQSNTVMFGWSRQREHLESQLRMMRTLSALGRSTIIAKINWAHEPGQQKRIDLWWGGLQNNGDLMLLLAYLLTLNSQWRDARLLVRSIARSEEERQSQLAALAELIPGTRIQAESEVILLERDQTIAELIRDRSRTADVVFLGLRGPEVGDEADYAATLEKLAGDLKTTIFVRSAGKFAGRLI